MFEDIDWYNGLLIKPQHMQTIKLLNYFKFLDLQQRLDKNLYGVIEASIDVSKVHEGIITVIRLLAINKDGTWIDYDIREDEYKLVLDLTQEQKLGVNIDSIYLYLATLSYNSKTTSNHNRYYKSKYGPIIDDAQSDHDEYIRVLKPKPMLLFEKDLLPKHAYMPLIKLNRNKGIWHTMDFNPPYLYITSEHSFIVQTNNIFNHLAKKMEELAVKIIHHKQYQVLDHKTIVDIHNYETINPIFFRLKQILALNNIRPYDLFLIMLELLHALTFSLYRINSLDIKYEHDSMHTCIAIVLNKVNEIIVDVLQQNIIFINFEISEVPGQICISIPREYQTINNYIYCFCNSDNHDKEQMYQFIENLVIYSSSQQSLVKNLRIRGIAREIIKQFSNVKELIGLSGLDSTVCFRLSIEDQYFKYEDRLIIELDEAQITNFKFNIILKQN